MFLIADMMHIELLTIPAGVIILTLGRKLFWLFVGGVGFIAGIHVAAGAFYGQPGWIVFLIALLVGLLGALLAVFLQRFAVILSAFLAGSFLVSNLIGMGGWQMGQMFWLLALIGGVIGALAAYHFFDWALIILSASTGAAVITENLGLGAPLSIVLPAVLFIAGVAVQARLMQRDRSKSSPKKIPDRG